MTRVRERGSASTVGYIVVGVLLAVVVVGGIYMVKHQLAGNTMPNSTKGTVATDDGGHAGSTDVQKGDSGKAELPSTKDRSKPGESAGNSATPSQTPPTSSEGAGLPATGSEGVIAQAAALATLTGTSLVYLRSRRDWSRAASF